MPTLQKIPLDQLDDHPDNPRLAYREDVIDGITAALGDEYPQKHAVHCRPVGDRYQLTSGHHRKRAAEKKGLSSVWAWVENMTDDSAFMELATSNNQGELSPLEIGIHALRAVPPQQGKKDKGLSAYAKSIGKARQYVSQMRTAAEVYQELRKSTCEVTPLAICDKAMHLDAIHSADCRVWPECVAAMLASDWTVKDTEHWVGKVKDICQAIETIGKDLEDVFLPREKVVKHFLDTKEFSAQTVTALGAKANSIIASIRDTLSDAPEPSVEAFRKWLAANVGQESWDIRAMEEYERELLAALRKPDDSWHLGDWREHIDSLESESVALVLTDPPYGMEYQSDYRLDRREGRRKHKPIASDAVGQAEFGDALAALYPKLRPDAHVLCFCHWSNEPEAREAIVAAGYQIRGSLIWTKNNTGMGDPKTTFAPKHERIIHAVKGSPILFGREPDVMEADRVDSSRHPTEKPVSLIMRLIETTTARSELVADPFGGVATTLVAAKELGRAYWGCEIDDVFHKAGNERLLNCQLNA